MVRKTLAKCVPRVCAGIFATVAIYSLPSQRCLAAAHLTRNYRSEHILVLNCDVIFYALTFRASYACVTPPSKRVVTFSTSLSIVSGINLRSRYEAFY
jgi:hypothetical protein